MKAAHFTGVRAYPKKPTPLTPLKPKQAIDVKGVKESTVSPVHETLKKLTAAGFTFTVVGEGFHWHGPSGILTDNDRAVLRASKAEAVALLCDYSSTAKSTPKYEEAEPSPTKVPLDSKSAAQWEAIAQQLTPPPALTEMPDLEFCEEGNLCGLWLRRIGDTVWIVPTRGTRPSYERYRRRRATSLIKPQNFRFITEIQPT